MYSVLLLRKLCFYYIQLCRACSKKENRPSPCVGFLVGQEVAEKYKTDAMLYKDKIRKDRLNLKLNSVKITTFYFCSGEAPVPGPERKGNHLGCLIF